jgi:hypothetical protein
MKVFDFPLISIVEDNTTEMKRGVSNSERSNRRTQGRGGWQTQGRGSWQSQRRGKGFQGRWNWFNNKYRGQSSSRGTVMPTLFNGPNVPSSQPHSSQIQIVDMFQSISSPYQGWKLYFPQEAYKEGSTTVNKVQAMEKFINKNSKNTNC